MEILALKKRFKARLRSTENRKWLRLSRVALQVIALTTANGDLASVRPFSWASQRVDGTKQLSRMSEKLKAEVTVRGKIEPKAEVTAKGKIEPKGGSYTKGEYRI